MNTESAAEPHLGLALTTLPEAFAVCRLGPDAAIPGWARGSVVSITRTERQLSVVCAADAVPDGVTAATDWRALEVAGPLDFALTGVVAALARPLAARRIPVFVISSYDTDHVLVRAADLSAAVAAIIDAGHAVDGVAREVPADVPRGDGW